MEKECDMRPGQQTPVGLNVAIFIVDHAKVCQMRGISPPHNTMNNSTSKHFTNSHTRLPLSHCSHKMEKALRPTGKSCLSFRGFRNTQQDTTMSLMFEYFTPTCPVTICTHLCTKCRHHHRRRNTAHPLCP